VKKRRKVKPGAFLPALAAAVVWGTGIAGVSAVGVGAPFVVSGISRYLPSLLIR
jgi:hypothetical protein